MYRDSVSKEKLASSMPSTCDIQLKRAINDAYPGGGIKVTVLNSTTASLDSLATTHVKEFEIVIIPDINSLLQPDQAKLVKIMRDCTVAIEKAQSTRIFIGVVHWNNPCSLQAPLRMGMKQVNQLPKLASSCPRLSVWALGSNTNSGLHVHPHIWILKVQLSLALIQEPIIALVWLRKRSRSQRARGRSY